jgi:fructokinase
MGWGMRIVVAGEALVDLVPDADASTHGRLRPLPGGSPFNVAIGLGRLGMQASYLGPLSDDGFGDLLAARLDEAGVARELTGRSALPSSLAMVHLDAAGHASYRFYLDGTSATSLTTDDVASLDTSSALHVSLGALTFATATTGPVLATLARAAAQRPFVSLDPNVRPAVIADRDAAARTMDDVVAHVDVVKASDADLETLYPGEDPLAVAGRWARSGPALVVVTRGEHGAVAVRREGGTLTVASPEVDVVDTVGAGDAFSSGLLAALDVRGALARDVLVALPASELAAALRFAAEVAALTCTRAGADPPRRDEVDAAV